MARNKNDQRPSTAKARAREAARLEAERLKQEREARARRRRTVTIASIAGGVVVTVALALAVFFTIPRESVENLEAQPAGAQSDGGILIGKDGVAGGDAPSAADAVTVEIYSDYMCPYCGMLEKGIASRLNEMREAGEVRVILHPLAFLDSYSNETQYSTRALNHAAQVAKDEPDKFMAFHEALFEDQPEENTDGLSDSEIVEIANRVGISAEVSAKFGAMEMSDWVAAVSNQAMADGITGTPRVFLTQPGGKRQGWESWSTGDIKGAVAKVKEGKDPDDQ
ncbi:MAG: thioredoxin domain-containing protein [Bifidobacteriaceae bacterium]|jgi:protein-disulfide isomerase|nr:thioredoxin domain-containing protein [Bifidobacteriaceae bacterium]